MLSRKGLAAVVAIVAALALAAASVAAATAPPRVSSVWARSSSTSTGAVYLTIAGRGTADRLVAASVPMSVAMDAQLHKSSMGSDGMMTMTHVKAIPVPASGTVKLKPGGYHVMLMGLKKPLAAGRSFPLTLAFAKAGKVKVTATVRAS